MSALDRVPSTTGTSSLASGSTELGLVKTTAAGVMQNMAQNPNDAEQILTIAMVQMHQVGKKEGKLEGIAETAQGQTKEAFKKVVQLATEVAGYKATLDMVVDEQARVASSLEEINEKVGKEEGRANVLQGNVQVLEEVTRELGSKYSEEKANRESLEGRVRQLEEAQLRLVKELSEAKGLNEAIQNRMSQIETLLSKNQEEKGEYSARIKILEEQTFLGQILRIVSLFFGNYTKFIYNMNFKSANFTWTALYVTAALINHRRGIIKNGLANQMIAMPLRLASPFIFLILAMKVVAYTGGSLVLNDQKIKESKKEVFKWFVLASVIIATNWYLRSTPRPMITVLHTY